MKKTAKHTKLDHRKLLGFRKVKSDGRSSTKPLTVAMVGETKIGFTKPPP